MTNIMKKGKLIGLVILSLFILSACKGYEITLVATPTENTTAENTESNEETGTQEQIDSSTENSEQDTSTQEEISTASNEETIAEEDFQVFNPSIKYANLYNGPLYITGMDWNTTNSSEEEFFTNIDDNGINYMLLFVTPDSNRDIIQSAIDNHPSRISLFTNPGFTTTELKTSFTNDELPSDYESIYNEVKANLGEIKGLGRLDISSLGINPTNSKIIGFYDFAQTEQKTIIMEIGTGSAQQEGMQEILTAYPQTNFFLHIHPEELESDETEYMSLLENNDNLFYIIDTNDILYDGDKGLAEKFSSQDTEDAISAFIEEYDRSGPVYINNAVLRYKNLLESYPERVVLGSYLPSEYDFNEEVYNRIIKAARTFIIKLDTDNREKFAYENALDILGEGR